jgi:hypothetical protein
MKLKILYDCLQSICQKSSPVKLHRQDRGKTAGYRRSGYDERRWTDAVSPLSQLGLDLLDHCLNQDLSIPFDDCLPFVFLFASFCPVVNFITKAPVDHFWIGVL